MNNLEFSIKLEKRIEDFVDNIYKLCRKIVKNQVDNEVIKQLARSAGSVGANYIEANESLSKKDFFHRIKICRKESKETRFWLKRLLKFNPEKEKPIKALIVESTEFVLLFSKIVSKS